MTTTDPAIIYSCPRCGITDTPCGHEWATASRTAPASGEVFDTRKLRNNADFLARKGWRKSALIEQAAAVEIDALLARLSASQAALREMMKRAEEAEAGFQIYALCDKHVQAGHFPPDVAPLQNPPIRQVCPWCARRNAP